MKETSTEPQAGGIPKVETLCKEFRVAGSTPAREID